MKKNRLILAAALLLCCLLLAACGSKKPAQTVNAPAVYPSAVPSAAPTTPVWPMNEQEQLTFIENNRSAWLPQDLEYETWFYTVTDLDHNGRLEVLTASLQGSGLYTYVDCREVNETCTGLNYCHDNLGEGEAWPDIIVNSLTFYRNPATGLYYYLCEDGVRDGAAHYLTTLESVCLDHGRIELRRLASKDETYTDPNNSVKRYYDENGAETTESTYLAVEQRFFAGFERGTLNLNWVQLEAQPTPQPQAPVQPVQPQVTAQPQYIPQPQVTAQPQYAPQPQLGGPVTVTKNPTSESLAAGGKTWFIAHANNASSLTWLFTSPQGQSFTMQQAMAANPGLRLQELPEDTLEVSNVPASFDNWSVQARFDGPGGSAVTAPAMIYVDDSMTVYGSVISAYYRAYTTGNTSAEYAFNNNLSEFIASAAHVGYALQDLDGNGTDELIVAGMLDNNYTELVLFDLYTLENGQPVQLATSRARSRFFLRSDGSVLNEGSNGAGNSIFIVNRLYGSQLAPVESAFTWFTGEPTDGYYHQTDGYFYEPRSYDDYLDEQQFTQLITGWESTIVFPKLTQIA